MRAFGYSRTHHEISLIDTGDLSSHSSVRHSSYLEPCRPGRNWTRATSTLPERREDRRKVRAVAPFKHRLRRGPLHFRGYVYPGSDIPVVSTIVPMRSRHPSESDFFARVPWGGAFRFDRVALVSTSESANGPPLRLTTQTPTLAARSPTSPDDVTPVGDRKPVRRSRT